MTVASGALDCLEFPVLDFIVATDGFLSVTPGAPRSLVGHVSIVASLRLLAPCCVIID